MMFDGGDHYIQEMMPVTGISTTKTKNSIKRRFNDEQIKSLELMFESETRLEPGKKLEVAKELGLHPRQVAIWFQNKRARCKSKQLEQDYTILQANYDILASKLESLKKERQGLVIQLQKLNHLLKKPKEEGHCCEQVTSMNSMDGELDQGEGVKSYSEGQLSLSMERSKHALGGLSDGDSGTNMDCFGVEERLNFINMAEPADGSSTSSEEWRGFDSDGLFDRYSSGYEWWDFWS